jgi:hypothetical protein
MWESISPYLVQVVLGIIAFVALLKDWKDYGKLSKKFGQFVPFGLAILTLLLTCFGLRETHSARVRAAKDGENARISETNKTAQISQLSQQVVQLREDNQKDSKAFRESFSTLYQKFSELQAKVQNAELLKEISATKKELLETQKKLDQPKATLIASFPVTDFGDVPKREITLSRSALGSFVEVQFAVYNTSDVLATNGALILRICDSCKYAEEPSGFHSVNGAPVNDREFLIQRVFARAGMQFLTARIEAPPGAQFVELALLISCENCVPVYPQKLRVLIK